MKHLDPYFIDDGIDGACKSSDDGHEVGAGNIMAGLWKNMLQLKILQRDHKKTDHNKKDSRNSSSGKDFADEKDGPDLGEKGGRTGDRIDQRKVTSPVGPDQADEVDGLEKAGRDGETPEFGRSLKEEPWESSKGDEKWEVENDPP